MAFKVDAFSASAKLPASPIGVLEHTLQKQSQQVEEIDPSLIHPFHSGTNGTKHPFDVHEQKVENLAESVRENGFLHPCIVRVDPAHRGQYEMISGHHRLAVAKKLGMSLPCIVKELDDDTAVIQVFETNRQRSFADMRPSEICRAIWMKREAQHRQGKTVPEDDTSPDGCSAIQEEEVPTMSRSYEALFLRLRHLTPELLALVDQKKMKLHAASALSFVQTDSQTVLCEFLDQHPQHLTGITHQKAMQLRTLGTDRPLTQEDLKAFFAANKGKQTKANTKISVSLDAAVIPNVESMSKKEIAAYVRDAIAAFQQNHQQDGID